MRHVDEAQYRALSAEAPFWGFMGAAFALIFSNLGAAYGTGKSGIGISTLGVGQPELVMKSIVPVCGHCLVHSPNSIQSSNSQ